MTRCTGIFILLLLSLAACDLPRDSEGTLDRVRGGTMRVGVVIDTPWTKDSAGVIGGIEGTMARALAESLGSRIEWIRASEGELLTALHHRELDLVIGGLRATSPWKQQVALTRPYYADTVSVGGAQNQAPPATLDKVPVSLRQGDPAAAEVRKKGGVPRFVPQLDSVQGPVAAPTWKLSQLGRRENTALRLMEDQHVLAAAPGENAFLMRVELMLIARQAAVPALLRQSSQ
jgi:polar amino acid transport system substrate-binding protein